MILILVIVLIILIYTKREEDESYLGLKLIGYYFLGSFAFNINSLSLPLGFILYLLAFRPIINKNTKKMAAILGLIVFIINIVFSGVDNFTFKIPRHVPVSSDNIYSIDLQKDLNLIKNKFNIDTPLSIKRFLMSFDNEGLIENIEYTLEDNNGTNSLLYNVNYIKNDGGSKYTITKDKINNTSSTDIFFTTLASDTFLEADYFLEKINVLKNKKLNKTYDIYTISLMETDTSYNIKDSKTILIDWSNNFRELSNDDLPVSGAWVKHSGAIEFPDEGTIPITDLTNDGNIDYIIEY